jgi:hypothetical protein
MDSLMYISNILLLLLPVLIALIVYLYRMVEGHLPANQRAALDKLASQAVQFVEQTGSSLTSDQKKLLASKSLVDLLEEFKLPVPSAQVIDVVIEGAVYLLNQVSQTTPTLMRIPVVKPAVTPAPVVAPVVSSDPSALSQPASSQSI